MSKLYQETLNEQEKSDFAATTMDGHLDEVAVAMHGLYRSVADEGEEIHDVRRQLELEQRLLKKSTKAIVVADHNRHATLDGRIFQRAETHELSGDLSNYLHSLAWQIRSRYPIGALRLLGLDKMADRAVPQAVLGMGIHVHERLLRPDPAIVPRPGREPLDFPALAGGLWSMVELVEVGLQTHAGTREAAASALAERHARRKWHRVVHQAILRRHEAACWLAKLDDVAARLRLRIRNTGSGEEPGTGSDPSSETPPSETPPSETPPSAA